MRRLPSWITSRRFPPNISHVMTNSGRLITEGKAEIRLPSEVFYNRVQEFNRDLTVAAIHHFQLHHAKEWLSRMTKKRQDKNPSGHVPITYGGIRILEALSASGIRSVRFALEVPNISMVFANDLDPEAARLINDNILLNNVENNVKATCSDAIDIMHQHKEYSKRFNVVDIDPYGTASPFLDSAVQCLHDGGLLCVTSTDMAVLCGSTPGTSMGKYGGLAVKNSAVQETGLRLLLHAIQSAASRHGRVIEPILSLSIDFYARVFVRIWTSAGAVKAIAAKHAICFTCTGCTAYHIQPLGRPVAASKRLIPAIGPPVSSHCAICGSVFHMWGPIWCGPLHNQSFLYSFLTSLGSQPRNPPPQNSSSMNTVDSQFSDPSLNSHYVCEPELSQPFPEGFSIEGNLTQPLLSEKPTERFCTYKRIIGMCTMAYEELPDIPLYFKADHLTAILGSEVPALEILFVFVAHRRQSEAQRSSNSTTDNEEAILVTSTTDDQTVEAGELAISCRRKRRMERHQKSLNLNGQDEGVIVVTSNRETVRNRLMFRAYESVVDFHIHPNAQPPSRADGLVRFQMKPEKHWGPKSRPKVHKPSDAEG